MKRPNAYTQVLQETQKRIAQPEQNRLTTLWEIQDVMSRFGLDVDPYVEPPQQSN